MISFGTLEKYSGLNSETDINLGNSTEKNYHKQDLHANLLQGF